MKTKQFLKSLSNLQRCAAVLLLLLIPFTYAWGDTTYYLQGISGSAGTSSLTEDFYTTATFSQSVSVSYGGVSYSKAVKFGGNITAITNNNYPDRMIRYDCKTTRTDFVIVAYANSNSKILYYGNIKEAAKGSANTVTAYSSQTLNNGSITPIKYSISSSTQASLFVSVGSNSNAFVVQIIATEKGDPLPTPGSVGYKVNFNKTRAVARSGVATMLDNNLEIHSNENITAGSTEKIKMQTKGTNYIKFTTAAACVAKITINGIGNGFYVADDKGATKNASALQNDGNKTYELAVGSGTHYIVPNGSNMYVEYLELAAAVVKDYTVTAATSTGTNTYGTVSAGASLLDQGETTTITATPATGYQVTNWAVSGTDASISPSGPSNATSTTLTMGSANATVTVTFGPVYASGTYTFTGHQSCGTSPNNKEISSSAYTNYDAFRVDELFFSATKMRYETGGEAQYDGWKIQYKDATIKFLVENDCNVKITLGANAGMNITYTRQNSTETTTALSANMTNSYDVEGGTLVTLTTTSSSTITLKEIQIAPSCSAPTTTFGNGEYTVGGSALDLSTLIGSNNSSGAITYTVKNANGTGASISTASFTATTAGTCTVTATQAANGDKCEKVMDATITVNATPSISSFSPASGSTIKSGTTITVSGSSSSTVYCLWASSTPSASDVKGGTAGTSGAATVTSAGIASANGTTLYAVATRGGATSSISSASYTIDDTAPTLLSSDPANGATGVATSGTIVLTFSEAIANVDGSKFTLTGATKGAVAKDGSNNTKVNIPYSGAANSATVTLATTAGAVSDAAGNTSAALSNISFTTVAAATYTVTYDGSSNDDGTVPEDGTSYSSGATVTVLGNTGSMTRSILDAPATFLGWNTSSNMYSGTHYDVGDKFEITSDITLYAVWGFNIYYKDEDKSTEITGLEPTYYIYGEGATLPTNPTPPTGYEFGGWYNAWCVDEEDTGASPCGGSAPCGFDDTHCKTTEIETTDTWDAEYYAKWTAKSCTVSFDNNGGTGGTNTVTATYGSSLPSKASNLPTKTGYNFDGYYDSETDNDGTGTKYYNADGSSARNWDKDTESATTLYAKWTAKTTTVTINANTGNHGSTTPGTVTATYGSALPSFTAASGEGGYSLTGYYTEATDGDKIINANGTLVASTSYADGSGNWNSEAATLTLYAQYAENVTTYNVTYDGDSPTTGSAPTDDTDYRSGDEVTVLGDNDMAKTGYTFVGWSDGTTLFLEGQKFNITSNVTLTAVWNAESEGSCKLVDIDFTDETTVSLSSTDTKTVDGVDVYFKGFTSITNGTGAIPYGNMSSNANYLAIPISGINGSISFTVTGESRPQLKYYILQYDVLPGEITDPGNTTNIDRPGSGSSVTVSDVSVSKSYAVLYLGRQSATNQIGTVSVTTPCSVSSGYTVSFEDGSTAPASHLTWPDDIEGIPSGSKILAPTAPTATGYTFGGWYSNAACTAGNEINWSTMTISADKTIYAKWTAKTTTLTFNANTSYGGTGANGGATATFDATTLSSISHTSAATGYTREGYYTTASGEGTKILNADGSLVKNTDYTTNDDTPKWKYTESSETFYARYTLNSHTLTWSWDGGSTSATEGTNYTAPGSVNYGTSLSYPANNTMSKDGCTFTGWSTDATTMPDNDLTITAQWSHNTYDVSLTLTDNKATKESGTIGTDAATHGTNYTLTFAAVTDYVLPSDVTVQIGGVTKTKGTEYTWSVSDGVGTLTITGSYITGNIAITVTATEAVTTFSVTYNGDGNTGGDVPTDATEYIGDGTESVTVATPANTFVKTDYTFRGWKYNGTFYLPGQSFTMPAADVELTAVWEPNSVTETLEDINFKSSDWSDKTFSQGNTTTMDQINGVDFYCKDASKAFSLASNTSNGLTFPADNMTSGNRYFCIPLQEGNINGSITVTLKHGYSSNTASYKYYFWDGATSHTGGNTNGKSGTDVSDANKSDTEMSVTITASNANHKGLLFIGRNSSSYTQIYGVTVTTPGTDEHFDVSFADQTGFGGTSTLPNTIYGVEDGLKILQMSDPTATGYTFGGWYDEAACGSGHEINWSTMTISADKTIYAKWTAKTTTLTFDPNTANHGTAGDGGATATYDATGLESITHTTPAEDYRRTGYWTAATSGDKILNADGTLVRNTTYTSDEDTPKWKSELSSLTLYAQYELDLYTITYNANGGSCATPTATQESVGEELTLPTPTWSGYTFDGWYNAGDKIGDAGDKYEPTEDITLYAKWTDNIDGKVFSFIDHNYGDKFKAFDESEWVTSSQDDKNKTYTNATTGVQFNIVKGTWETKTNAIAALIKFNGKGTHASSMSIVIPTGYIATVKILYGAYGTGDNYCLTVGGVKQANPDNKLDNESTNAQVISAMKEITLENQTGTLTLGINNTDKNLYIGRVAATITGYQTLTYVGGDGSNWSTTANWSPACLPTIEHDVVLNVPVEVNSTSAVAKSVTIYNDGDTKTGHLDIPATGALVIAQTLRKTTDGETMGATGENDVYIHSTSSGTGALVMGSHDGTNKATVEFYSLGRKNNEGKKVYQYIGTPFNDVADAQYNYYGSWMYRWNAGSYSWTKMSNGMPVVAFMGYSIAQPSTDYRTYWMQGTLVSSTNVAKALERHSAGGGKPNENMFANSWMAPISLAAMESSDFGGADATIYIFNAGSDAQNEAGGGGMAGSQTEANPGQYTTAPIKTSGWMDVSGNILTVIPSMQAFSVLAPDEDDATLTLDYSKHVLTPALSSVTIEPNRAPGRRNVIANNNRPPMLRLFVNGESFGDQLWMFMRNDFSLGFDNGYDGRKLVGDSKAPQLYATTPDGNMAIHCTPAVDGTILGFKPGQDASYTFSFIYDGDETLYLNDLKTETSTLIREGNTYNFTYEDGDAVNRFMISATPFAKTTPTGIEDADWNGTGVQKVIYKDHMYIIRGGRVFDATGAMVK